MTDQESPVIAAVDLGSNSFHLSLAKIQHNNLQIVGRLKEKVRLAAGLDENAYLSEDAQQRAIDCLLQFQQRLSDMPSTHVRAVATYTLRKAKNARDFLQKATDALGYPIEVISGHEEARLIYEGVTQFQSSHKKQLVVDIGGGSTEFAVGEAFDPVLLDSLQMGCVSYTQRYFTDGTLSKSSFGQAITAARLELISIQDLYQREGWEKVIGTSGTIESILEIAQVANPRLDAITLDDLEQLRHKIQSFESIDELQLDGLPEQRREILPAGLAILIAVFQTMNIESMKVSPAALREGILYELTGRKKTFDIKERAITGLLTRYHIDFDQARRVSHSALLIWQKVNKGWQIEDDYFRQLVIWASRCHEIGLSINFSRQQKHGEYIILNADISGFSVQQQQILALMIRSFRRKFPSDRYLMFNEELFRSQLIAVARILRLAVLINHQRRDHAHPDMAITASQQTMNIQFPENYLDTHVLLHADLAQEKAFLKTVDMRLDFS